MRDCVHEIGLDSIQLFKMSNFLNHDGDFNFGNQAGLDIKYPPIFYSYFSAAGECVLGFKNIQQVRMIKNLTHHHSYWLVYFRRKYLASRLIDRDQMSI